MSFPTTSNVIHNLKTTARTRPFTETIEEVVDYLQNQPLQQLDCLLMSIEDEYPRNDMQWASVGINLMVIMFWEDLTRDLAPSVIDSFVENDEAKEFMKNDYLNEIIPLGNEV